MSIAPPVTSMPRLTSACLKADAMNSVGLSTDTVCVTSVFPTGTRPLTRELTAARLAREADVGLAALRRRGDGGVNRQAAALRLSR